MPTSRRLCALVAAVIAFGGVRGSARQPADTTRDLLLRYAAGDLSFVENPQQIVRRGVKALHDDLKQLSPQWLASDDRDGGPPGRRVLAAFALEVSANGLLNGQALSAAALIDWTRQTVILPHRPPDVFDRDWHRVLLAVIEFARWPMADLDRHIMVALKQFPEEPRFVLARAFAAEQQLSPSLDHGAEMSAAKLKEARTRLQEAAALPDVQGEAELRLAYIDLRMGEYATSLAHLGVAEQHLTERDLIYLVRLFRAYGFAGLQRFDAADRIYQGALALIPNAQTATLAHASLLFQRGDRERADALVQALLTRARVPADPWWAFRTGDARLLPALVHAMRAGLKP